MKYRFSIFILSLIFGLHSFVFAEQTPPPEFSHEAGMFTEEFELHFTSGNETSVFYTTDGSVPDQSATMYTEGNGILVNGSMVVRTIAYGDGLEPSEIVTKVFSQLHDNVADFSSNLPLAIVHQFDDILHPWGEERSEIYITILDQQEDGRTRLNSTDLHLQSRSESNYRGSSSLSFPKKQFGVRLIDDQNENRNESILGMPSENNWIMSAPWDDRTLMRNTIAYQISSDMGHYAPRTRFVELFLHDGHGPLTEEHYHGVYMLTERIKWDNNRVNIQKLSSDDNAEPEVTGGYIINYEHGRESHIWSIFRGTEFALIRPQNEDITQSQRVWIQQYLGDLERALFGSDFKDPETGYAKFLDPDTFIDYHWITETFKEMDGFRLSTILHKDRGGKLKMGPVWDYNLSFGNHNEAEGWNGHSPIGWYHTNLSEGMYLNGWYTRLFEDPEFAENYRLRWWELRNGAFDTDHIVNMIENYAELLDEAQQRNFERWDIIGEDVWHYSRDGLESYEAEVEFIVDWIQDRLEWIDSQMGDPPTEIADDRQLRYFWYFGEEMENDFPFEKIEAGYSLVDQAQIRFQSALAGYPFHEEHENWRKASMERRNRPTNINYLPEGNYGLEYQQNTMRALQVRQPFTGDGGENTLIFDIPTTDIEDILFRFAAMDEGAADALLIDYSTSTDDTGWTTAGLEEHRLELSGDYELYQIYFSGIPDVDNNPDFKIRIRFDGDDMSADDGNRVTFNNFSVQTSPTDPTNIYYDDEINVTKIALRQNFPNPFNPNTIIQYDIPSGNKVRLEVFDMMGRRVAVLVDEQKPAGTHQVNFDASQLSSGVYMYRLDVANTQYSRMMTLIK